MNEISETEETLKEKEAATVTEDVSADSDEVQGITDDDADQKAGETTITDDESVTAPPADETDRERRLGVTPEPRNANEIHMRVFHGDPDAEDGYLRVSDEKGEILGNIELQSEIEEFTSQYADVSNIKAEEVDDVLEPANNYIKRYSTAVSRSESFCFGVTTKYRLFLGMLLNIAKKLVLKQKQCSWEEYYNNNYPETTRRSAQDYMRLAKVKGIIGHAYWGGKEILLEIVRLIDTEGGEDPIGDFLLKYDIHFNPDDPPADVSKIRKKIDAAVAMEKIRRIEQRSNIDLGVDEERIRDLVGMGVQVDNGFLNQLGRIKTSNGDVNGYLDSRIQNGGAENTITEAEQKYESIQRLTSHVKRIREDFRSNPALQEQVKLEQIEELEAEITALKNLLSN